jgi:hypothetical protein
MYAKVFSQIYDGTLCTRGPWQALVTFQQLLVLADLEGCVDMTVNAIARRTTIPLEIIEQGIVELLKPDPESRTPTHEGRRIIPLSEGRSWGWLIVNYKHYRQLKREEDRREYHREYWHKRKHKTQQTQHTQPNQPIAEAEADTVKTIAAKAAHPVKPGDARFNAFWKAYPRKVGKDAARKAFDKRKPDDALVQCMIRAIVWQARSEDWRKDGGQYIPHPATWLNEGRWMDEGIISPTAPAVELWQPPAAMTDAEREAADKARRAALGAIRRVNA